MRIVAFFMYLCFLLIGGNDYVHASIPQTNGACVKAPASDKQPEVKRTSTNQNYQTFKDVSIDIEELFLLSDDVEDEDSNNYVTVKDKLLVRYSVTPSYQSILNYLHNCYTAAPPFFGQIQNIYIIQRDLRI